MHVGRIHADRLGNAGSGASQEEKKRVIPPSASNLAVWRVQKGIHFGVGQIVRCFRYAALVWDLQYALRNAERSGITYSDMAEKGTNGGKARISRTRSVSAVS